MDKLSQEMFDSLIEMDKDSLSEEQLAFLMARRPYMNDVQRTRFAKEIKLHEDGKLFAPKEEAESDDEAPVVAKKKVAKTK